LTELETGVEVPVPLGDAVPARFGRHRSLWRTAYAMVGVPGCVIAGVVVVAIVGQFLTPKSPIAIHDYAVNLPPFKDWSFPLGTDNLGRDVLSRAVAGTGLSLMIGVLPVALAGVIGFSVGAFAAFGPRSTSFVILRMLDIAFAFPAVMLAIAVAAVLGPSVTNAMAAMVVVLIPPIARVSRTAALDVAGRPYVVAARMSGASWFRVTRDFAPVLIYCASLCGLMIIFGAGLSFIGVGVQPPTAEWGRMVSDARTQFVVNPWISLIPGACIFVLSLCFNMLADHLRDYLDPRTRAMRVEL
jgi:peptide/nickel transport system permease protein